MVIDAQVVGGLQVVAGVLALILLKPAIDNPDTAGSSGYALLTVGTALWMFSLGWSNFVANYTLFTFGYHFLVLGTELAAAGWLFLALFATNRTNLIRHTAPVVGAGIVLLQLLLWTNPLHNVMYQSGPGVVEGIVRSKNEAFVATAGWWWIHVAASYLLVGAGEALLLWERFRSAGIRRKQFTWLSLTFVPVFAASVVSTFGLFDLPYNISSLGFLLALPFLAVGLFRTQFLDIVPVARRTAMAELDAAVVTLDEQDRVVDANRRARELFDSGRDYVGTDVREFFAPVPDDVLSRFIDSDNADTELPVTVEDRHFSISITPVGERTTRGRVVLLHEITSQKQREEELRKREQEIGRAHEQLRQIIDLVPDPLFVKNLDDEVLLSNEANAELHGMTPEELEGQREFDIEPDVENIENFDKYRQREKAVIETGKAMTFEEELLNSDGETRVFKITRIPFKTSDTDEDAVLGYARDVTDLKEYEQELEETQRTLEQSNEKLEQFAGIVSHDLRNPLNVIKTRMKLLHPDAPDEHVEPVLRNVDRMESMIEDLLTLSRAGESVDEPDSISLATVVTDSWAAVSSEDIELEVDIPAGFEVEADGNRLRHVFENLFRNAKEHNEPPVTVRVGTLSGETGSVSGFFIADDGAGIPESDREEVFEHGYTTNTDGTGFGLSIVKEIVEAHGWTISLTESDAGGIRFEVHISRQR
jgi:PAS domain S-box-containing protein